MIEFEKVSRYDIVEKVAESPFAVVYRGRDSTSRRPVAIKVCIAADSAFRQRFLRLAEAAAPLRHPHIVEILEFGSGDGKPYLIEEFLTGEDLRHRIARRGTVDGERELALLSEVARGLEHAHRKGVLHQDLKPATVHLEDGERVKLVDFGIARLASAAIRLASPAAFSAAGGYLPPEQALGLPADARTDVFCFGALAYELLSRHPPFPGSSPAELLDRALVGRPVPLGDLWPECPPAFSALVDRCLSASPGARPAGFDELNEELAPIHEQLRGRPRRFARRVDETLSGRAVSLDDTMAIPPEMTRLREPAGSARAGKPDAREESLKTAYVVPPPSLDETLESTLVASVPFLPSAMSAPLPTAAAAAAEVPMATAAVPPAAVEPQPRPARLPWMPALPDSAPSRALPTAPTPVPKTQPVRPALRQRPRWLVPALGAAGLLAATALLMSLRTDSPPAPAPAGSSAAVSPGALATPPPQAQAEAPRIESSGLLVIDATPWAEIVRVVDAAGRELPLPAVRYTPLSLAVPAGHFKAELVRPGSRKPAREPASCEAVVAAGGTAVCRADLGRFEAADYFKETGWWR